jgi:hypothetical protein
MNGSASNELELEAGLSLAVTEAGAWIAKTDDKTFSLDGVSDFYRAWLLLERPFSEVKEAVDQIALRTNAVEPFPFAKLIESALMSRSRQWTERALPWISHLPTPEKTSLRELLLDVREANWVSQKGRQLAQRYLNEINRRRG